MANEINDVIEGLAGVLEQISGLRVYQYHPDSIHEYPAAVLTYEPDADVTLPGLSFQGQVTITLIAGPRLTKEITPEFYSMLSPLGVKSIKAAVEADTTWGGKVDHGRIAAGPRFDNLGYREFPWYETGPLYAVDIHTTFVKQVLPE